MNDIPLAGLLQDVRYGIRLLRRQPAFAAVAILTMALGIGATTTLFSIVDGVLLKPLPWPQPDRLIRVTETRNGRGGRVAGTISNAVFLAWRGQSSTIEDIGGWLTQTVTLTGVGDPVRLSILRTTPSLFPTLEAKPLIGRLFRDDEGLFGQPGAVILSYGLWQDRFGGPANIVGQVVQLDEKPYTVVGVMGREFAFPDRDTRAWTAWAVPPVAHKDGSLSGVIFRAIARLRAGVTPEQAAAEATARARSATDMGVVARSLFGAEGPIDVSAIPELQAMTADVRPAILILLAAVALLLATATASVASLQLARATTRRREMAVRAAIGAGQRRLVRQLMIENAIVVLGGGVAGLALAAGLDRILPSLVPAELPRLDGIGIDLRVLGFTLAVSLATSLVCGLLPAWHARRLNLVETLAEDGGASVGTGRRSWPARTRMVIMAGQVAIACVLLVGAILLARSFIDLLRADRGYDPVNVLTARLVVPSDYPIDRTPELLDTIVQRVRAVPGVTHAAYSTALPFMSFGGFIAFTMHSPLKPDTDISVQAAQRIVSPDYFAAMRLRLVAGRTLSESDTATTRPVVVVNRSFAQQYLGDHPVGMHIAPTGPSTGFRFLSERAGWDVVGVVDDMQQGSVESSPGSTPTPIPQVQPEIFASFAQMSPAVFRSFSPIFVVRTVTDPMADVPTLRGIVHQEAPTLALDSIMTMQHRVMESVEKPRLYAIVLVLFGAFALLIAGVGLSGVLSFSVAQRTREIGVRSALGAQASDIVALVLRQAFWIVGVGVAVGLAAALAGTRVLSAFLYGVGPHNLATFIVVPVVIVIAAAIACVVPARRAATTDPLTALRSG